jgi:hypothetical protein
LKTQNEVDIVLTNELGVGHFGGVELDAERLGVARRAGADLSVGRVRRGGVPARVAHGGLQNALVLFGRVVFEEDVLDAPEAAGGERGDLRCRSCE